MAAFIFAGVGFYSFSPNFLDTEFCCKENHNVEGKDFKLYLFNAMNTTVLGELNYI